MGEFGRTRGAARVLLVLVIKVFCASAARQISLSEWAVIYIQMRPDVWQTGGPCVEGQMGHRDMIKHRVFAWALDKWVTHTYLSKLSGRLVCMIDLNRTRSDVVFICAGMYLHRPQRRHVELPYLVRICCVFAMHRRTIGYGRNRTQGRLGHTTSPSWSGCIA